MSNRPGIGTGNPGKDTRQVAKPIRVLVLKHDPTMSADELASHFSAEYRGEVRA